MRCAACGSAAHVEGELVVAKGGRMGNPQVEAARLGLPPRRRAARALSRPQGLTLGGYDLATLCPNKSWLPYPAFAILALPRGRVK